MTVYKGIVFWNIRVTFYRNSRFYKVTGKFLKKWIWHLKQDEDRQKVFEGFLNYRTGNSHKLEIMKLDRRESRSKHT